MMIFLVFLFIGINGFLATFIIENTFDFLMRLAIGYSVGIGITTLLLLYISILGGSFSAQIIVILLIAIFVGIIILLFKLNRAEQILLLISREKTKWKNFYSNTSTLYKIFFFILLGYIIFVLLGITSYNFYSPISTWDAFTSYDYTGRILSKIPNILGATKQAGGIQNYPLFTALSHSIVYIFGGDNPKFTYSLLLFCFSILFYESLKKYRDPLFALALTFLLITSSYIYSQSQTAYTNFPLTFYYGMGVIYLYIFMKSEEKSYFWLSTIFLSLSYWVRTESKNFLVATLAVFILYTLIKKKYYEYPFILAGIFFATGKPWEWYYKNILENAATPLIEKTNFPGLYSARQDITHGDELEEKFYDFEHLQYVGTYILNALRGALDNNNINFFLLVFIFNIKNIFKENIWMFLLLISHIGIFMGGTLIFSISFTEFASIQDSATRLAMIFIPMVLYYIGTTELFSKK